MVCPNRFTGPRHDLDGHIERKNQVVIPEEARKKLGVGPGARLLVPVEEDHKGLWGKGHLERERRAWRR